MGNFIPFVRIYSSYLQLVSSWNGKFLKLLITIYCIFCVIRKKDLTLHSQIPCIMLPHDLF